MGLGSDVVFVKRSVLQLSGVKSFETVQTPLRSGLYGLLGRLAASEGPIVVHFVHIVFICFCCIMWNNAIRPRHVNTDIYGYDIMI